jgi:hypothetical protein
MDTEALTVKVIPLAGPVTTNTGTSCAGLGNGSAKEARRQRMMSLMWLTPDHALSVIRFRASDGDVFSEVEVDGEEGPIQGDILGDPQLASA